MVNKYWLYRYNPYGRVWVLLGSEAPRYDQRAAEQRAELLKQSFSNNFEYGVVYTDVPQGCVETHEILYKTNKIVFKKRLTYF